MTALGTASASTRTVERALTVLAEVCSETSLSLSECARRASLPPSTALRLLRTLEASGFVQRGTDGSYSAGIRVIQLGAAALGRQSLVRLTEPGLRRIVARTGESAYVAIRGPEDTAVFIAVVEGTHPVRHTSWVGRALPLGELAVGRALRGDVGPDGYAVHRDPDSPDVTGIAAPVEWSGGIAAALNLVGPTYRIDETTVHEYGVIVRDEARAVAAQLAADGQPARRKVTGA
jgi:urocanate hydratase